MIEIIPVNYGKSALPESMIFENGAENKFRPIIFRIYLLKTENRLILVDAGCETMPGFDMTDFIGPVKALNNIGISPEGITDLIITHAHHGGHSKGSSIVEITDADKKYVIAGDECYMRDCLTKQIPTGASYNPEKSRAFIKKYGAEEYTVFLCHEE